MCMNAKDLLHILPYTFHLDTHQYIWQCAQHAVIYSVPVVYTFLNVLETCNAFPDYNFCHRRSNIRFFSSALVELLRKNVTPCIILVSFSRAAETKQKCD